MTARHLRARQLADRRLQAWRVYDDPAVTRAPESRAAQATGERPAALRQSQGLPGTRALPRSARLWSPLQRRAGCRIAGAPRRAICDRARVRLPLTERTSRTRACAHARTPR